MDKNTKNKIPFTDNIISSSNVALSLMKNAFLFPQMPNPTKVDNYTYNTPGLFNRNAGGSNNPDKNLGNLALPIPPARTVETIEDWRTAIIEAERSILPYRVQVQQIFRDTYLNPHVFACMSKRKELTTLRNFAIVDKNGNVDKSKTKLIKKSWLRKIIDYSLDAQFYGYSLISLGDLIEGNFPLVTIIRRDLISPERREVTTIPYNPSGYCFDDEPWRESHVYVSTPSEHGTNACGMGILYTVALREINLRNLYGFNMDFLEMFGAPYRALFMQDIYNETERLRGVNTLKNQGAGTFGVFGEKDRVEFLSPGSGSGWKAYSEAELRWNKDISKAILGHADAMDSVPGKLGSSQGGGKNGQDHTPIKDALVNKQAVDGLFIENIINEELLPRLRDDFGFDISEDFNFKFLNSEEDESILEKQNENNLILSQITKNLIGSNIQIDAKYFEDLTGIKVNEITPIITPNNNF